MLLISKIVNYSNCVYNFFCVLLTENFVTCYYWGVDDSIVGAYTINNYSSYSNMLIIYNVIEFNRENNRDTL